MKTAVGGLRSSLRAASSVRGPSRGVWTSQQFIEREEKHGAHNYHPLPVVLTKGQGCKVWDVEGKEYYDFLSAYSA
ncbi:hypothetical protein BBJ28_00026650, partial [Nothophytophthora sp. Chile5]